MLVHEPQNILTLVLTDITCDVCGKSCWDYVGVDYDYATLQADWGYNTNKDGTQWLCHICSECADKIKDFIESQGGNIITTYK